MAIDRESVWIKQMVSTHPHIYPGWNFVTAAEKTALSAEGVLSPGHDDERRRPHIIRDAPIVPTP